jgi:DNA-binding NtrC family response regulator
MKSHLLPENPVLVVDDDAADLETLILLLKSNGITNVIGCSDSRKVLGLLRGEEIEAVLLDLMMPHVSGEELLDQIRSEFPEVPVIVVTVTNDVATAVRCVKAGAFDYLVKIVEESRLVTLVRRAVDVRCLRRDYRDLAARFLANELQHPEAFAAILTQDKAMRAVFLMAESVARTSQPVLITGETGVGKNLLAQAIHKVSEREGRFVDVNVGGLDDTAFSDTLFGHKRGAYTGAEKDRDGLVQSARGGTLFLDEIGELSVASQVKLLQLLNSRRYYPLGWDLPRQTDAKIIAATNQDLDVLMESGRFRKDLYNRLSMFEITIPPLRERKGDLPILFHHFLEEAARELGRKKPSVPPQVLTLLAAYHYPFNVPDVPRIILNAMAHDPADTLSLESFEKAIGRTADKTNRPPCGLFASVEPLPPIRLATDLLIDEALKRAGNNKRIAASLLGISRQALEGRLKTRQNRERE